MSDTILIPFSGGVNSTYSLWRWLTETNYNVHVRHSYTDVGGPKEIQVELQKVRDIVDYIKKETRDFIYEELPWKLDYTPDRQPIREGFKVGTWDVGRVLPRYTGYGYWIKELRPDAICIGISLENTTMDTGYSVLRKHFEDAGVDIYLSGCPKLEPVPQGDEFDWDDVAAKMIGRFEQFQFMPEELAYMTRKHDINICEDTKCRDCAYWKAYDTFIKYGYTGRDLDLYCAKMGSYGPFRHEADPETYVYRGAVLKYLGSAKDIRKVLSGELLW
jgi:hypothetical protein